MPKVIRSVAICLGLALASMLYAPSVGFADGPRNYCADSGPTDGGDGHPWDDDTGQDATPGDDGTIEPQQEILPSDLVVQPILSIQKGLVTWTERALVSIWYKVRHEVLSQQKTATKAAKEYKAKQSRPVR